MSPIQASTQIRFGRLIKRKLSANFLCDLDAANNDCIVGSVIYTENVPLNGLHTRKRGRLSCSYSVQPLGDETVKIDEKLSNLKPVIPLKRLFDDYWSPEVWRL